MIYLMSAKYKFPIIKCILLCIAIGVWVSFIFGNSLQTGNESGALSGQVVTILQMWFPFVNQLFSYEQLQVVVRKAAHISEYAILGAMLWSCWHCIIKYQIYQLTSHKYQAVVKHTFTNRECLIISQITFVFASFTGLVIALVDETIQTFVPARAGLVSDVWIDSIGIFGIQIVLSLCWYYIRKRKVVGKL